MFWKLCFCSILIGLMDLFHICFYGWYKTMLAILDWCILISGWHLNLPFTCAINYVQMLFIILEFSVWILLLMIVHKSVRNAQWKLLPCQEPVRSAVIDSCIRVTDNGKASIHRKVWTLETLCFSEILEQFCWHARDTFF